MPIRIILGLPFLLFFPGYTLVVALFVKKEPMDVIEKVALSCGISIAIVSLIGFGLNYTPWGIRLEPVLYSINAFIFLMSFIALFNKAKTLKTNIFISVYNVKLPGWGGSTFNKSLSIILIIILIISIFGALGILGYTIAAPKIGEKFTEFYVLGINGKAQDYPTEYVMTNGQVTQVIYNNGTIDNDSSMGIVTIGIVNHEQQIVNYYLKIKINNEPVDINYNETYTDTLGPINLQQSAKWEDIIGFIPNKTGYNQKVEFLLFKDNEAKPEGSLWFWINIKTVE